MVDRFHQVGVATELEPIEQAGVSGNLSGRALRQRGRGGSEIKGLAQAGRRGDVDLTVQPRLRACVAEVQREVEPGTMVVDDNGGLVEMLIRGGVKRQGGMTRRGAVEPDSLQARPGGCSERDFVTGVNPAARGIANHDDPGPNRTAGEVNISVLSTHVDILTGRGDLADTPGVNAHLDDGVVAIRINSVLRMTQSNIGVVAVAIDVGAATAEDSVAGVAVDGEVVAP